MRHADVRRAHMPPPSHAMVRILLLAVCLSFATSASAGDPAPSVRIVPTDFPTITAAIDVSTTGDEIIVKPGTYDESLVIDGKFALTLRAQKPGSVRVTGEDGIVVSNSTRVAIIGLVVDGAQNNGVFFDDDTSECRLERVSVIDCDDFAFNIDGERHVVSRCSVGGDDVTFFGFQIRGENTVLSRCSATSCVVAGFFEGEAHVVIGCKVKDTTAGFVMSAENSLLADTTFTKIVGVAIDVEAENVTVRDNRIRRAECGIDIDEPSTIVGNRITKVDDIGIAVESFGVIVADNIVSSARVGLDISLGVDTTRVVGNKVRGSSETDIIDGGTNSVLVDNVFKTFLLTGT